MGKEVRQKIYKAQNTKNINMLPGDSSELPDESFFQYDTLIFIDAGFISKLSNSFGKGKYLIYDLEKFAKLLCKNQKLNCRQIFYYTAPPFQSPIPTKSEDKKTKGYDKFVKNLRDKKILVREGRCQRLKVDGNFEYHQKAVDILLAMDLTIIPTQFPSIKKIILISSDSDFVPVIKKLQENGIKTILYTYYKKRRNTNFSRSNDLIKSVYKYILLNKLDFDNCPLDKK